MQQLYGYKKKERRMDESYCHERHVSEFSFLPSDAIGKPLVDVQASNGKRTEDLHDRGDIEVRPCHFAILLDIQRLVSLSLIVLGSCSW